jgi:hypothetical protein
MDPTGTHLEMDAQLVADGNERQQSEENAYDPYRVNRTPRQLRPQCDR